MISLAVKRRLLEALRPREAPSLLKWAESNIIIPDGPYRGQPFDADTQPFSRLFLQEVGSGRWDRIVATGPTQTGKSLLCYVIPVAYHLFALGETVVAGLPNLEMATDKWEADFLPVMEASPALRQWLPSAGTGSRGGRVKTRVRFRNGATLRFMSGGGHDKTRAGFTGRILAITEVDGMDTPREASREADPIRQLEGRQRAFLAAGIRTYLECTVTSTTGRIWNEYLGGTQSRIARPCPACKQYVSPEREQLIGWKEAENELEARAGAAWSCPSCSATWTEAQRYAANLCGVLVHRGQEVTPEGQVVGPVPPTRTLGFRWAAVDNHFAAAADAAADEWQALREPNRENAEKELKQFVHCIPYSPHEVEVVPLSPDAVTKRTAALKKGIVPAGAVGVTVGIDTGKRLLHWCAVAWTSAGGGHVIEYGDQTVAADKLGVKAGLIAALRTLSGYFARGWQSQDGKQYVPAQVWIDSGYHEHQDPVHTYCQEATAGQGLRAGSEVYRPSKGYGEGQRRIGRYWQPRKTGTEVRFIGLEYHLTWVPKWRVMAVHMNADYWKSELHNRLVLPPDAPSAITLFEAADPAEHQEFGEHLTAERQIEKWVEDKGEAITWQRIRRKNHYLDAAYASVAAGHLLLTGPRQEPVKTLRQMAEQANGA